MQIKEGDEGPEVDHHEEWQAGNPGDLSGVPHQDVPHREDVIMNKRSKSSLKPLRELYPTMKFDGKVYQFYHSRMYKAEALRDKKALKRIHGDRARVVKRQGRYLVFRLKKS